MDTCWVWGGLEAAQGNGWASWAARELAWAAPITRQAGGLGRLGRGPTEHRTKVLGGRFQVLQAVVGKG